MDRSELLRTNSKGVAFLEVLAENKRNKKTSGMLSLFGDQQEELIDFKQFVNKPTEMELLIVEKSVLGIMLQNPFKKYWRIIYDNCNSNLFTIREDIDNQKFGKDLKFIAIVEKVEQWTSKGGNKYVKIFVYDNKGDEHIYMSLKQWDSYKNYLFSNKIYLFKVNTDAYGLKFVQAKDIESFEQKTGSKFIIRANLVYGNWRLPVFTKILQNCQKGDYQVFINNVPTKISIEPNLEIIEDIKNIYGLNVKLE